jgi:Tfp pilus assembly protein PilV
VLLLMITISMVGFAWLWLSRLTTGAQANTTAQANQLANTAGQQVKIDSARSSTGAVTIRNVGASTVTLSTLSFYANGTVPVDVATCTWVPAGATLASGSLTTCTAPLLATCASVKVTSASGTDTAACQ